MGRYTEACKRHSGTVTDAGIRDLTVFAPQRCELRPVMRPTPPRLAYPGIARLLDAVPRHVQRREEHQGQQRPVRRSWRRPWAPRTPRGRWGSCRRWPLRRSAGSAADDASPRGQRPRVLPRGDRIDLFQQDHRVTDDHTKQREDAEIGDKAQRLTAEQRGTRRSRPGARRDYQQQPLESLQLDHQHRHHDKQHQRRRRRRDSGPWHFPRPRADHHGVTGGQLRAEGFEAGAKSRTTVAGHDPEHAGLDSDRGQPAAPPHEGLLQLIADARDL